MRLQFLPTLGHNIVYFFVTGIANPSAGLIFAGVCTGWFIGLFLLSVTDLITRQHDSGLVSSINYVKNNAIDAALFFMILMFSANVVAGTSLAHICGKWVILDCLQLISSHC